MCILPFYFCRPERHLCYNLALSFRVAGTEEAIWALRNDRPEPPRLWAGDTNRRNSALYYLPPPQLTSSSLCSNLKPTLSSAGIYVLHALNHHALHQLRQPRNPARTRSPRETPRVLVHRRLPRSPRTHDALPCTCIAALPEIYLLSRSLLAAPAVHA